jgi:hypothetical protein
MIREGGELRNDIIAYPWYTLRLVQAKTSLVGLLS